MKHAGSFRAASLMLGLSTLAEARPKTHRLEPSPATVAYGPY